MKKTLVLLILIFTAACATTPALPPPQQTPYNFIPDGGAAITPVEIPGWRAFVNMDIKGASTEETSLIVKIKAQAEEKLKDVGFKLTTAKGEADVVLELKYRVNRFEEAFPEHAGRKVNGEAPASMVLHRIVTVGNNDYAYALDSSKSKTFGTFTFTTIAQEFEKHAQSIYWLSVRGANNTPDFTVAMSTAGKNWVDELTKLKPMVKEKKQAGLPGCGPQFGFELEPYFGGGAIFQKVVSIGKPGSPAREAKMKTGDFLLSVNGVPYAEFAAKPDLHEKAYSEKIPVSIMLLRNKKEIRSSLKAKVLCD